MERYFKISKISKLYNIGNDSLRYYEKMGLLKPSRDSNGYRMYSLNDLWRLNVIRDLLEMGFSIKKISEYLKNRSTSTTLQLLNEELNLLDEKIEALSQLKNSVQERIETITLAQVQPVGVVGRRKIKERRCHVIEEGYTLDEEMDLLIKRLLNMENENSSIIGNNRIGSYMNLESSKEGKYIYDAVFLVSENGKHTIPSGEYLTLTHHGDTSKNYIYIPELLNYAKNNSLTPMGPIVELLWVDIHSASDMREHLTELQLRVVVNQQN